MSLIKLAEAQLLGFKHAQEGATLKSLVESMGLTKREWNLMQSRYEMPYLSDADKNEIEEILGA
jgi:hypothetical protein